DRCPHHHRCSPAIACAYWTGTIWRGQSIGWGSCAAIGRPRCLVTRWSSMIRSGMWPRMSFRVKMRTPKRTLLPEVVPMVAERDCIVADRNFCTMGFLFGMARRGAFFVIRQHGSNVIGELQGPRRMVGHDARGQTLYEQTMCLTEADAGATL